MTTIAEKAHMGRVAALCCIVCRKLRLADDSPAEVHHIRTGQGRMRAKHTDTIPLCVTHHRGADGIHTLGTKAWQARFFPEAELLAEVHQLLGA